MYIFFQFIAIFARVRLEEMPLAQVYEHILMECITPNGILNLINKIKLSKSAVENGINSDILKCTKDIPSVLLSEMFL